MRSLYKEKTANYPRLKTDRFFADYENTYNYSGFVDESIKFIEDFQLLDTELWKRFVYQFEEKPDIDSGWRGEYWGKMMRGACFVYSYTKNQELYSILENSVREMMTKADDLGRISSYPIEKEFESWDIWCRKYVLLGMQYFLEITDDEELSKEIIDSMCRQADYLVEKIGVGKVPITVSKTCWRGLNSSSILEPIVRLYSLTNDKKYLDFAEYIVGVGGTDVENIFELAYENDFAPYQYPVTKAYEMTSCFEGLMEYYRIVGNDKHKTAVINFANKVLETDFTVIGSAGCTSELFDHSTVRQANTNNCDIMQETCVTVTLMKFFYGVHLLTGEAKFADAFETSFYNAYLGAINTEKKVSQNIKREYTDWCQDPMPFDSYSPLTEDSRGRMVGGLRHMSDNHYYGCCACIGSLGAGLVPKMQLLSKDDGFVLNLFINGTVNTKTPKGKDITFITKTEYPKDSKVTITLSMKEKESFSIYIRNPEWSKKTYVNGKKTLDKGYIKLYGEWKDGDTIDLDFDFRCEVIKPIPYGEQILMTKENWEHCYMLPKFDREDPLAKCHIALRRGPLMLSTDTRLKNGEKPYKVNIEKGYVTPEVMDTKDAPYKSIVYLSVKTKDGVLKLTDYASAGKTWDDESKVAVWIRVK